MEYRRFSEQRSCFNLRAMRYLPPQTYLPRPATAEERQLLDDLVALPDDADPLLWLRQERGTLTARIALYNALGIIKGLTYSAWIDSPAERAVVRDLWHLLEHRAHGIEAETLLLVLQGLRPLRELVPAIEAQFKPPAKPSEEVLLLFDVLALSPADDPLVWLQRARGDLMARMTFSTVVQQGLPRPVLRIHPPIRAVQVAAVYRSDHLQLAAREILFGSDGFALSMSAHLTVPHLPWPDTRSLSGLLEWIQEWVGPSWGGFDQVIDDRGYHYIVRYSPLTAGTERSCPDDFPARYRPALFAFYPSIAPDVGALTFISHTTELILQPPASLHLPALPIDPFTWRLAIPR